MNPAIRSAVRSAAWPLRGLAFFLRHPALWLRPLLASLVSLLAVLGVVLAVAWWWWPAPELHGFWSRALAIGIALALSGAAGVVLWVVLAPLLMVLALESLARAVFAARGLPVRELPLRASLFAGLRVVLNTLPARLGWPAASLVAGFFGPMSALVGACGLAHIAAIDAHDIAWSFTARDGLTRLQTMRADVAAVRGGALVGAALLLALGLTVVGTVLWLPAMVCGAALRVADGESASR